MSYLLTIFYLPLLPIGVLITLCGFILWYLIEKYNTTHFYKIPPKINSTITLGHLESFKIFILIFSISIYIFMKNVFDNSFNYSLLSLILFAVLTVIPYSKILEIDLLNYKERVDTHYEDEYLNFIENYDSQNPVTKKKAKLKYLDHMKNKNILSDQEYNDFKRRIYIGEFVDLYEIYRDRIVKKNMELNNIILSSMCQFNMKHKDINKQGCINNNFDEIEKIKQRTCKLVKMSKQTALASFFNNSNVVYDAKANNGLSTGAKNIVKFKLPNEDKEKRSNSSNRSSQNFINDSDKKDNENRAKEGVDANREMEYINNNNNNNKINEINEVFDYITDKKKNNDQKLTDNNIN